MDQWTGEVTVEGEPSMDGGVFEVFFDCTVRDHGPDGEPHTADDQLRILHDGFAHFDGAGDLSGISYVESGGHYHSSGDIILVYDDGCSGSPDGDYYDDDYYDDDYYDDSYESDCDGDVYDDDYSYDDSSYDDYSYDDSSCDYEDSGDSDSDWDWGGDDYEQSSYLLRPMSLGGSLGRLCAGPLKRPLRILPLLLAVVVVLMLRRYPARRRRRSATISPAS
jgi:hypothetical protein